MPQAGPRTEQVTWVPRIDFVRGRFARDEINVHRFPYGFGSVHTQTQGWWTGRARRRNWCGVRGTNSRMAGREDAGKQGDRQFPGITFLPLPVIGGCPSPFIKMSFFLHFPGREPQFWFLFLRYANGTAHRKVCGMDASEQRPSSHSHSTWGRCGYQPPAPSLSQSFGNRMSISGCEIGVFTQTPPVEGGGGRGR